MCSLGYFRGFDPWPCSGLLNIAVCAVNGCHCMSRPTERKTCLLQSYHVCGGPCSCDGYSEWKPCIGMNASFSYRFSQRK